MNATTDATISSALEHELPPLEDICGAQGRYDSHFECPVMYALSIINPKWSVPILLELYLQEHSVRFNTLERALSPVTQKELSKRLRELEKVGVITRALYPEIPPRVEYSLTESGKALIPLLKALTAWSFNYGQITEIPDIYPEDETPNENQAGDSGT